MVKSDRFLRVGELYSGLILASPQLRSSAGKARPGRFIMDIVSQEKCSECATTILATMVTVIMEI